MSRLRGTLFPAAVLALALVTGCGTLATRSNDDASDTAAASAEVTTTPETEGAESPGNEGSSDTGAGTSTRAQNNQVAVTVPQLPIGGEGQDAAFEQCVSVSYLGDAPIPQGVSISVTDASLTPPLLEVGGSACSADEIPCLSSEFVFVENPDSGADTCFIPVQATGERPDEDDENSIDERVVLAIEGLAVCPPGEQSPCEDFAATADADGQTIPLDVRIVETTTEETTEQTSESTTTSESESTEQTTEETSESTEDTSSSEGAGTPPD
jgi:hypothetical protein